MRLKEATRTLQIPYRTAHRFLDKRPVSLKKDVTTKNNRTYLDQKVFNYLKHESNQLDKRTRNRELFISFKQAGQELGTSPNTIYYRANHFKDYLKKRGDIKQIKTGTGKVTVINREGLKMIRDPFNRSLDRPKPSNNLPVRRREDWFTIEHTAKELDLPLKTVKSRVQKLSRMNGMNKHIINVLGLKYISGKVVQDVKNYPELIRRNGRIYEPIRLFSKNLNIKAGTFESRLIRHRNELEGHYIKKGGNNYFDSYAISYLNKKPYTQLTKPKKLFSGKLKDGLTTQVSQKEVRSAAKHAPENHHKESKPAKSKPSRAKTVDRKLKTAQHQIPKKVMERYRHALACYNRAKSNHRKHFIGKVIGAIIGTATLITLMWRHKK